MLSRRGPLSSVVPIVFLVSGLAFAPACSDTSGQDPTLADKAAANIENADEIMEETYKKSRAEGEGRIEAAGDAYNAVLDENLKKAGDE